MQNERKAIAPFLYYTIVSSLTSLVFIVVGLFVFTLLSYRITNAFAITVILVLLLWKDVIVAGFMTWSFHKYSDNKDFAVKYIGLYLGHFYGIFIGGFLGARIANLLGLADIIGFMIGALALYFIGRWIGSRVSITIGDQVDKVVSLKEYQLKDKVVKATPRKQVFLFLYFVVLPWLVVIIALLLNYFDIAGNYLIEWLPIARIIAIVLSVLSICFPWLMRKRQFIEFQSSTSSPGSVAYWLGLSWSVVPVIYGMFLFLAMGVSIIELCLYAMASSTAAIVWSIYNPWLKEQKAS
jgi:hypothetical protein